jgi:hypothetical protein
MSKVLMGASVPLQTFAPTNGGIYPSGGGVLDAKPDPNYTKAVEDTNENAPNTQGGGNSDGGNGDGGNGDGGNDIVAKLKQYAPYIIVGGLLLFYVMRKK